MSLAYTPDRLQLPESLRGAVARVSPPGLDDQDGRGGRRGGLRRAGRLPRCCSASTALWDTPALAARRLCSWRPWSAARTCPVALHRWVWRHRRLEQLARLLARKHPRVGDQLLGIIELVRNDFEQARSRALCEAAIREVAEDAQSARFPRRRARTRGTGCGPGWRRCRSSLAVALGCRCFRPRPRNAWARFLAPWSSTPRYTFTALEHLPDRSGRRARRAVLGRRPGSASRPSGSPQQGDRPSSAASTPVAARLERRPL